MQILGVDIYRTSRRGKQIRKSFEMTEESYENLISLAYEYDKQAKIKGYRVREKD